MPLFRSSTLADTFYIAHRALDIVNCSLNLVFFKFFKCLFLRERDTHTE